VRRVTCYSLGPPEELVVEEAEAPSPGPGQVVLDVRAAGVNFVDALLVTGGYQVRPPLPFTPGGEVAGVVSTIGEGVEGWRPDDAVIAMTGLGGFAEQVAVPAPSLVAAPDGLDAGRGATFIQSYATNLFALTRRSRIEPGETALVLGAGGGVGLAAVDLVVALGGRAIAAASTGEKLDAARAVGAAACIAYENDDVDLKTEARRLSEGGVDVVVDTVGGRFAEPGLRALRVGGRYLVVGFASGAIPSLPLNQILLNNRTVVGVDWGAWVGANRAANRALVEELVAMLSAGRLRPPEPTSYPLEDAPRALSDLMSRRITGKAVVLP
jgi:NADPH:quinone reductase